MAGAFLYDNAVSRAVSVTAAGAEPSAGVSNLLDPQPRLRMRCTGSTAAMLLDLGASVPLDCVALVSTSASVLAQVRVRLSSSDPTGVAGDVWDSGLATADTSAACNGNVVVVRAAPAAGRYLLVELTDGAAAVVDVGHLVAGQMWRLSRAQSYGLREGRLTLDQRDRNPLTGAEFPIPALFNPRFTVFQAANLRDSEWRAQARPMIDRLGAVTDALWIPDTGLSRAEMNRRAIWGAAAQPGDDAGAERTNFVGWTQAWRLIERG